MNIISIIIACYNSEGTIRKCLESVVAQVYNNWECLIIDGASKDKTIEIVKEYANRDNRIRYVSEPDNGIYDAFNKGWKMAKGEWIYYLGSDDQIEPNGLVDLLSQAKQPQAYDVIYGNIKYLKDDGHIDIHKHHSHNQLPWKTFACHQALIMRRTIIDRLGGFDEKIKIIADKDLIIRSYFLNPSCKYKETEALVALYKGGGASYNLYECFKEDIYIYRKVKPGFMYLLYAIQHFPRMWLKVKLKII